MMDKTFVENLTARKVKLAVAESCTGGMLAGRLTDISGISQVFLGGVVAYANEIKIDLLDVPSSVIEKQGAVSEEAAQLMADGIRRLTGATHGFSTTGVAGPGGGSQEKPVGTVFVGISCDEYKKVFPLSLKGNRQDVRNSTVEFVMEKIIELF